MNACGSGSAISSNFTTGEIKCVQYTSADVPKSIDADERSSVISKIDITENEVVTDVNIINIEGLHTWISDLEFRVMSPSGTEVVLLSRECDSERNFDLGFDDESSLVEFPCPYNDGRIFKPSNPLANFKNESTLGEWKLQVLDLSDLDGGQLNGWILEICTNISKTISTSELTIGKIVNAYPNPVSDFLFLDAEKSDSDFTYSIISVSGMRLISNVKNNRINVSGLPEGMYLLEVKNDKRILGVKKILVSR
jgi:subtilisin-like proprotein convertase family protein